MDQSSKILEALAHEGRLDAEATDVAGEYRVGEQRVRVELTPRRVVVYAGQARVSLPSTATAGAVARAVIAALGTPVASEAKLGYRQVAGRSLYLVSGSAGRALVLAASPGAALALGRKRAGADARVDEATEAESGRHEDVVCEDGARPLAVVFSALAALR
jgi:hypothetical protein